MIRFYVSFICHFFIPVCFQRLRRAAHPPIFCCLAGAQFTGSVTCLATNRLVLVLKATALLQVHSSYFSVRTSLNMFLYHVSFICHFSIPACYKRLSRAIHRHSFSHLARAQFSDCITCLATNNFVAI